MKTKPFEIQEALAHPERVVHRHIPEWVAKSVSVDPDDKVAPVRVMWSHATSPCFYTEQGRLTPADDIPRIALKVVNDTPRVALKVVKGYPHAALMKQYAEDAETHERPWELWEYKDTFDKSWQPCGFHPVWYSDSEYRRTAGQLEIEYGEAYRVAGGVAICISCGANLPNGMSCVLLVTDSDDNQYVAETDNRGRLKDGEQFVVSKHFVAKGCDETQDKEIQPAGRTRTA